MNELHSKELAQVSDASRAHQTLPIPPIGAEREANLINREISWLAFNERVVAESENPRHPLLERLRFIAISANNLDEFMTVRVAGMKQQANLGMMSEASDALPADVLAAISQRVQHLQKRQQDILPGLFNEMSDQGVSLITRHDLKDGDADYLSTYFMGEILPVIAPLTIDPAHPFPIYCQFRLWVIHGAQNPKRCDVTSPRHAFPETAPLYPSALIFRRRTFYFG